MSNMPICPVPTTLGVTAGTWEAGWSYQNLS